ncbi:LysR family transcriptional regulator [Silvimonas sp. JCM 19000]
MDLRSLDLNLLVSLDALLEERNVTRAAARLHLSQPALSAQLARLRLSFNDPLLIPAERGRGMVATARGLQLHAELAPLLQSLARVVSHRPQFDPLTHEQVFHIAASDNATAVIGLPLIEALRTHAGEKIRLAFHNLEPDRIASQLENGEIDFVIASSRTLPPQVRSLLLLDQGCVLAQRKGHPRGNQAVSVDEYCTLKHILVSQDGGGLYGFADEALARLGRTRQVALSVQHFTVVPLILQRTDYVSILPTPLVQRHLHVLDAFEVPFEVPISNFSLAWHPRNQQDGASIWLRQLALRTIRDVAQPELYSVFSAVT